MRIEIEFTVRSWILSTKVESRMVQLAWRLDITPCDEGKKKSDCKRQGLFMNTVSLIIVYIMPIHNCQRNTCMAPAKKHTTIHT